MTGSGSAELNGARLHWLTAGSGPAVVLLHAFPLDARMWQPLLDRLPDDRTWIAPDYRGFGSSDVGREPLSVELLADDAAHILDHLGHESAALCGVSMGGYVAFAFWREYRDRLTGLILCDTRSGADTPEGKLKRRLDSERVRLEGSDAAVELSLDRVLGRTTLEERPGVVAHVRALIEDVRPESFARAQSAMAQRPDASPIVDEIDVPTLVVVGEEDTIISISDAKALTESLPRGSLEIVQHAGHLPPIERPDVFAGLITSFLDA